MKTSKLLVLSLLTLLYTSLYPIQLVLAENFDIASTYQINDNEAVDGDILIVVPNKGLLRADSPYDGRIFGVLWSNPVVVLKNLNAPANEKPVIRIGDSVVNVTDFNGVIQPGDYVSSSPIPGKGMKSTQSGYGIGIATSAVASTGQQLDIAGKKVNVGQVNVAIRIEYAELNTARSTNRLLEEVNSAFFRNVQDPEKFTLVVRYIMAGIVAIIFFLISFFGFTRSISKGIEAIGRNPLAKSAIQFSIAIHLGLAIVVSIIGLVIVFIIIRV